MELKITHVSNHRTKGKGTLVGNYAVTGSKEAVAQYVKDKEAEIGKCPMVDETDTPRFIAQVGQFSAKSGKIVRTQAGGWRVDNEANDVILATINSSRGIVQEKLAEAYANKIMAGLGKSTASIAVETPSETPNL